MRKNLVRTVAGAFVETKHSLPPSVVTGEPPGVFRGPGARSLTVIRAESRKNISDTLVKTFANHHLLGFNRSC